MTGVQEILDRDAEALDLFAHLYGLSTVEERAFRALVGRDRPVTVNQLSDDLDYERSTTYRAVQRLCRVGLLEKRQRNYDNGGYYHVYRVPDPESVAVETWETLNELYAVMDRLIETYRKTYASEASTCEREVRASEPDADTERESDAESEPKSAMRVGGR